MNVHYLVHAAFLLAGIAVASGQAVAQDAAKKTHVPLQKTIGVAPATAPEPSLAVINSAEARLEGNKLILTGVSANSIVFADRPVRAAGHVTTEQFIMQWDQGKDSFAIDPPNATVSVLGGSGSDIADAVVTLKSAKLEGTTLTFDVAVLEGNLNGATGPAALFIDFFAARFGGAGGFHGVAVGGYRGGAYWHAPVYRGAWYGAGAGAAVGAAVAGAAVGAAVAAPYYNPYAPPPPPPCGYYPYPRCY
jgi:hypothetical protein